MKPWNNIDFPPGFRNPVGEMLQPPLRGPMAFVVQASTRRQCLNLRNWSTSMVAKVSRMR